ncbi:hypothetical protein DPM35_02480 [Mesorhizobium atlanticum]|uniref:S9 family peptidase n=1 Tax=Mesorhizobium atlanticum TaxID=2233532 RepID=A0A330GY55_9HYPH|nr:hypothetical protein DPM35_02480 [Mesorhizobium atlanticum]
MTRTTIAASLSPDGSRLTFASDGSTAQVTLARRKP